jgi:hypothetical protein
MNLAQKRLIYPGFLSGICEPGLSGAKDYAELGWTLLNDLPNVATGPLANALETFFFFFFFFF